MSTPGQDVPRPLLPLADDRPPERADAARNRALLLETARRLVERDGVCGVTMDRLASEAGVGKGTVFRRFSSREGLMGELLDFSESGWQAAVLSGPPPLGPGAPPRERLLAFGRSRIETTLLHADLIAASGYPGGRSVAAIGFIASHVRHLLGEIGVEGDLPLLTTALIAPLEVPVLVQQVRREGHSVARVQDAWADLVRRVLDAPPAAAGPRPAP
ncbi:TetR/AcrR family transcriptional regulator [Nocardioides sp. TRM66260-LWL]|uniref:TetR/AcrR family transcriptional regulator n=1 Tax=Nocardioides sp. TRM66260-LWL TaxID=2874478 RepID=UPI001CC3F981|nr:TetR/AcrR family transcriptional regulator [Nocardioides sp. TRM66260-LWL]MBZ5733105.1 TetR/AcrR family transcriptional regulator [Nocardioides sp. TRM66260-LWL]